jgi:hypothetical protein
LEALRILNLNLVGQNIISTQLCFSLFKDLGLLVFILSCLNIISRYNSLLVYTVDMEETRNGYITLEESSNVYEHGDDGVSFVPARVVVAGHSFVRRLDDFLVSKNGLYHNFGFEYNVANTTVKAHQKYYVNDIKKDWTISSVEPHLIYLEIGCNDLNDATLGPDAVAASMYQLAAHLIQNSRKCPIIMFGEIMHRNYQGMSPLVDDYNLKVDRANSCLKALIDPSNIPNCYFWEHRDLAKKILKYLNTDGIHVSDTRQRLYYRSVRGALLNGIRQAGFDGLLNTEAGN